MKDHLTIHLGTDTLTNDFPLLYYKKAYLSSQQHSQLVCYENDDFFIPFVLSGSMAISIPRSPFGSFFVKDTFDTDSFHAFLTAVKNDLVGRGIQSIEVRQAPNSYTHSVPESELSAAGFLLVMTDINQHISLHTSLEHKMHKMQLRKMAALESEGFEFKMIDSSSVAMVHQFIDVCRQVQGLTINITLDLLEKLSRSTEAYDFFGVFRESKLSAVCIVAKVTDKHAYYYLPATSPTFKSHSPMVLLIAGMVDYYKNQGFSVFDLGLSSLNGTPQESLRVFKERMGAEEAGKTTWQLSLQ